MTTSRVLHHERFKAFLRSHGMNLTDAAKAMGFSLSTVASWAKKDTRVGEKCLGPLLAFLGAEAAGTFVGGQGGGGGPSIIRIETPAEFPICAFAAASSDFNSGTFYTLGGQVATHRIPSGCYLVEVHGDSMDPVLRDRQLAWVNPEAPFSDGDLVLAKLDSGSSAFKRLHYDGPAHYLLKSIKPGHEPVRIARNEVTIEKVVGAWYEKRHV